jgi:hypothetical protein
MKYLRELIDRSPLWFQDFIDWNGDDLPDGTDYADDIR